METNIPIQSHAAGSPLLLLLGTALSAAIAAVVPIGLLVVPALFAYAMLRTKPAYLALFGGVYAALSFLVFPALTAACLAVLCPGMAFALYAMQTKKMSNTYTLLALFGIALLALYALVCLPGILSGDGAFTNVQAATDGLVHDLRQMAAALPELPEGVAISMQGYMELLEVFRKSVTSLVVPALCAAAGALGLSNLLFFHLFAKKQAQDISPMRPFRLWSIPQNLTYGMLFLLIASLVLMWTGWDYAEGLSGTVNVLVGMPLMLQGLCVTDFLIVRSGKNVAVKRTFLYLGTAVLFQFAESMMMMLGCFEQLFHIRLRASVPPPSMPRDGF